MASEERTRGLLEAAGFTDVRAEDVPVRLVFRDVDEYERWGREVGGQFGAVLRGLPESELEALRAALGEAFDRFAADGSYVLPGIALCAAAS
jgi:hypothetical protein